MIVVISCFFVLLLFLNAVITPLTNAFIAGNKPYENFWIIYGVIIFIIVATNLLLILIEFLLKIF